MKLFILFVSLYFSVSFLIFAQTPDNIPQFQTFYVSETGNNLSSGTYFFKLTSGTFTDIKKMQLIK